MLKIENLSVSFSDKKIIENCNFIFEENKFYTIFGKSGTGKSTLLKTFANLIEYNGYIYYNDENILKIKPQKLRKEIHYLHQEPILFDGSVEDNLKLPFILKNNSELYYDREKAIEILENMDLSESIINQKAQKLSGGEKQRICLARALLMNPKYLLLDEPSSALDMSNEMQIIEIIKNISKNITVIAVSHSAKIILHSDIQILMENANIIQIDEELTIDKIYEIVDNEQSNS